jgi:hypothetical protein
LRSTTDRRDQTGWNDLWGRLPDDTDSEVVHVARLRIVEGLGADEACGLEELVERVEGERPDPGTWASCDAGPLVGERVEVSASDDVREVDRVLLAPGDHLAVAAGPSPGEEDVDVEIPNDVSASRVEVSREPRGRRSLRRVVACHFVRAGIRPGTLRQRRVGHHGGRQASRDK